MTQRRSGSDPHDVLGVARGASRDEIVRAYRQRARELHPDAHPDEDGDAGALRMVIEAYRALVERGAPRDDRPPVGPNAIVIPVRRPADRTATCRTCRGARVVRVPCSDCAGRGVRMTRSPWLRSVTECSTCDGYGYGFVPCPRCRARR